MIKVADILRVTTHGPSRITMISRSTTYSLYWSVKLLAIPKKFKTQPPDQLLINAGDNSLRIIRVFTNVLYMTLTKR